MTRMSIAEQTQPIAAPQDAVVYADHVTKQFGDFVAVQDINFAVPRGTIFGFIGPSGSGKTTTVRLLTGIYKPTSGAVSVLGRSTRFTRTMRQEIGYMPQLFVLYPDLSVWENLNFAASLYGLGLRRGKWLNQLLDFVQLSEHRHKLARDISGGMQRRLSMAATLVHNPLLIFLDEPTASIDPILREKFWEHFKQLRNQGRTLFVTTQYVGEAAYCDLVGVLAEGRLLLIDTPDGLRKRAFGGDVIDVTTLAPLEYPFTQQLRQLPFLRGPLTRTSDTGLRLAVDDAGQAIPVLLDWFRQRNIAVQSVEQYLPPFDDVFVKLVREEVARA